MVCRKREEEGRGEQRRGRREESREEGKGGGKRKVAQLMSKR
jgi:hypothetical protein